MWELCVITDRKVSGGLSHREMAERALQGGASIIQLRDKEASPRALLPEAFALAQLCRQYGATFIVNDRLDLALASGADGVHLGQDDLPAQAARRLLQGKLLGVSTHSVEQAVQAEEDGADYIGVGPIFPTATKETGYRPLGLEGLRKIREAVKIPVLAIGGIDFENAPLVIQAGADGVAVISAVVGAHDITQAAHRLWGIVRSAKERCSMVDGGCWKRWDSP
ncbi:MAG: thiamine phosphate synthase [Candidatus Methylomirabilales bacterium]